jgi:hypothetical protein
MYREAEAPVPLSQDWDNRVIELAARPMSLNLGEVKVVYRRSKRTKTTAPVPAEIDRISYNLVSPWLYRDIGLEGAGVDSAIG